MPRKAAESEALSESQRIFQERRKAALQQAKAFKAADAGLFGDISVVCLPPDPAKEEPPADEPLSEEEKEIERAYAESAGPPLPEDIAAVEVYSGAAEEAEPLGPESFGGSDEGSHLMAQTSAARLREELSAAEALAAGSDELRRIDEEIAEAVFQREEDAILTVEEEEEGQEESAGEAGADGDAKVSALLTSAPEAADTPDASSSPAGFSLFGHNLFGDQVKAKSSGPLSERFKLPPFTVFDARQGIWQDRKRAWLALGIQSEVGRGENLLKMSDTVLEPDPVKRAELVKAREKKRNHAFGQEFVLGAQPGIDGAPGGQGKAWHTNDTGLSRKLAPGGGGGGAWIGGPKTGSSAKYGREGEEDVVLDEEGNPLAAKTGTSIFDPVLTELLYSWFSPPAGDIFDPFAGGSVRGIVAAKLGRNYFGIELRPEQIEANRNQAKRICQGEEKRPVWIEGDSTNAAQLFEEARRPGVPFPGFDFLIACPPYGDLEQYSDDPRDLSNMTWENFSEGYFKIIEAALGLLKNDRFACFVVGDIRDEKGFYRGLPELTVQCFEAAGAKKYNEAVLVTSVGSLPIRIGKQFGGGRKLGKTHQNVLVFVKGDPKRGAEACGGQQEFSL